MGTLVTRAGISEAAFREVFETPEDCITEAFNEGLQRLSGAVLKAACREEFWLERIRVGLVALLEFLDDEPEWAHLLILERPFEGAISEQCTQRLRSALSEVLSEARQAVVIGSQLEPPAELIAELLATAVLSVIRAQMLKGRGRPLVMLAPSLMSFVLVPYLGRGAAQADGLGDRPAGAQLPPRPEVLPIRPHPRLLLALEVIASTPHLSNQKVGIAVGIEGDGGGQIAKLLKPLERRGLIENTSLRRRHNEPNAWLLTPYGHRVLQLLTGKPAPASCSEQQAPLSPRASYRAPSRSDSLDTRPARRAA